MLRTATFFTVLLLFCTCALARASAKPMPVLVSIAPQKYILERIAGDLLSISVLVKPGADPHSYEPSPSQMRQVLEAKAWFSIGVSFEDIWLERIRGVAPRLLIISCIQGITRLPISDAPHAHDEAKPEQGHASGEEDPHVWLSPMLVREMVPGMARELGKLMPEHASALRARAREFFRELELLDSELLERFESVPQEKRVFLTFHPSWRYFAHNYQLREISIEQEGKEPGPQKMKATVDAARQLGIRAVFIEPQFSQSAAKAVAASLGARIVAVDPLSEKLPELYRDMADKLLETFPE